VAPRLNCLFAFDGSISCLRKRDIPAIDAGSHALVARRSIGLETKDLVDTEDNGGIIEARRNIDLERVDPIDTGDKSTYIEARQRGFSGYALNCAFNREFTEYCAGSPFRYYCTADGRLAVNQPGPQAIMNANCDGNSTLYWLEMRIESYQLTWTSAQNNAHARMLMWLLILIASSGLMGASLA
jgi:hypothetical protein